MDMYLIFGPTCTGKTAAAITLSKQTGVPVVALDRVQCCPQLSTGSGRPTVAELRETKRIYLTELPLTEGIITAKRAHDNLIGEVYLHEPQGGLILEGGSISLMKCMARSRYWDNHFRWHITRHELRDEEAFLTAAKTRVRNMLRPQEGESLLQELAYLWTHRAVRSELEKIDGYRYAIHFSKLNNLAVDELVHLGPDQMEKLVDGIAREYLIHARLQERELPIPAQVGGVYEGHPFQLRWP
ncbi:isopentenyl transferase [Agrobacterium vitis]|uniref:Adenylate dimethylallyltransferase n=2 Tax=Agrobacterium TaxID=357 RepID=A0A2Z2PVG7_AGRTU|nr:MULTISPECIES: isopentenyl transferase family protein [Rhizobium/Agrobacterium group]MCF1502040.1 isopentenyl transferase [Allorhizobium sp. Av2]ASK46917.1 isopentenyl transferase [Agrobacterium radiobacter]KAA3503406.1 isopentenyl transferase [Agrobacterium vitis]KAA3519288.1 isopentenyl transferase [Agrobacterium vitis]MCE6078260.1 isopentenyl transferase [Agrobacterium vitis]